jgi:lipopolysaccharide transport system ATP-binding protein
MAILDLDSVSLTVSRMKSQTHGDESEINLLHKVDLQIKSGDRVGVIGLNGSGKTTLLRMLSGVYRPTKGAIRTEGEVSCLLDSGLGLELERTAIENIRVYGLLKGQKRKVIENSIENILEFAGLKSFSRMPVRFFSQGMYLRLAFTLATEWPAEILLIDEGIGTGDFEFQKRANDRLKTHLESTSILVISSHSRELIESYCTSAILMSQGKATQFNSVQEAYSNYIRP